MGIASTGNASGKVESVGVAVYWDQNLTRRCDFVEWGEIETGASKSVAIFVRNENQVPVTLELSTVNWRPADAANYLTLTWSYDGTPIGAGSSVKLTLTLDAADRILGISSFSFTAVVSAA
jgi:hypothetical protein